MSAGRGGAVNPVAILRAAARRGDEAAQLALGQRLETGRGVEANPAEAHFWYSLAASSGNEMAARARARLTWELDVATVADSLSRAAAWRPGDDSSVAPAAPSEPAEPTRWAGSLIDQAHDLAPGGSATAIPPAAEPVLSGRAPDTSSAAPAGRPALVPDFDVSSVTAPRLEPPPAEGIEPVVAEPPEAKLPAPTPPAAPDTPELPVEFDLSGPTSPPVVSAPAVPARQAPPSVPGPIASEPNPPTPPAPPAFETASSPPVGAPGAPPPVTPDSAPPRAEPDPPAEVAPPVAPTAVGPVARPATPSVAPGTNPAGLTPPSATPPTDTPQVAAVPGLDIPGPSSAPPPREQGFAQIRAPARPVFPVDAPRGPSRQLLGAAASGNPRLVAQALSAGVDVNAVDAAGWTPLMFAAHGGHLAIVDRLLTVGADPNQRDARGGTALIAAVTQRRGRVIDRLLEAGARLEFRNAAGLTAQEIAAAEGDAALARRLDPGAAVDRDFRPNPALAEVQAPPVVAGLGAQLEPVDPPRFEAPSTGPAPARTSPTGGTRTPPPLAAESGIPALLPLDRYEDPPPRPMPARPRALVATPAPPSPGALELAPPRTPPAPLPAGPTNPVPAPADIAPAAPPALTAAEPAGPTPGSLAAIATPPTRPEPEPPAPADPRAEALLSGLNGRWAEDCGGDWIAYRRLDGDRFEVTLSGQAGIYEEVIAVDGERLRARALTGELVVDTVYRIEGPDRMVLEETSYTQAGATFFRNRPEEPLRRCR